MPSAWMVSPIFWLPLGALVSFLLTFRLFNLPMVSDEGGYAYAADRWFSGRGELYHDIWISRPQAIFVIYGFVIKTLGGSTVDFRIVAWLFGVVTMVVVGKLVSLWSGPRVAAGATMIFALLIGSPAIEGFTANAEAFMALPAALSVLTLWIALQRGWTMRWLVLTGALIGLATQLKPSAISMLAVALG
ncbi:MAG TPA: glycosyltransferase family 39 protein, partial [Thermomicrobiales bacterium]|nr:glycosyltransferase family 39 protein [Thermomicrobiales bacterium]